MYIFAATKQQMINQKLIFPSTSKNKSLWQIQYGLNEAYGWFVLIRYKVNVPAIVTFIKVRTCGSSGFPTVPFKESFENILGPLLLRQYGLAAYW